MKSAKETTQFEYPASCRKSTCVCFTCTCSDDCTTDKHKSKKNQQNYRNVRYVQSYTQPDYL